MDFGEAFERVRDPLDFHEALSTATDPRVEMGVLLAIDANRTTSPALQSGLTRNRLQSGLTRNRPETSRGQFLVVHLVGSESQGPGQMHPGVWHGEVVRLPR